MTDDDVNKFMDSSRKIEFAMGKSRTQPLST